MVEMTLFHLYAAVRKREGVDDGGHIQGEDLRIAILRVFVSGVNVFGGGWGWKVDTGAFDLFR